MADLTGTTVTLLTLPLRVEHDLVRLRRRVRASCEELGLPDRIVHSFSAAAFEAARLVFLDRGRADADLRVTQTAVEIALTATPVDSQTKARLARPLAPLAALTTITVGSEGDRLTVVLSAPLSDERGAEGQRGPQEPDPSEGEDPQASLRRRVEELSVELEETNRGVVALYAELDEQADRLQQADDRFKVLLDSVQDYAICMLDPRGEVVSWNAGAERLFGYTADEIIGRHFSCFYTHADRDAGLHEEHLRTVSELDRSDNEHVCVRRGGSSFDAHVVLSSMRRATGALRGFSMVVRDITSRKRLEDDLRRRADELAAANRAKEEFLATLSHELRTPLNAMLGWTRLLRMGKLEGPAMSRALETIERNAHIQEQLIADILDVSRIVTGKLRLKLRAIDLTPIVEASLDAVRPAADAKGVKLAGEIGFAGPVLGDPDRLQQVVWNLLANAIKFTPSGGAVSLRVSREGPSAVITVTDTGEGIASDLLPFIFDRFRQGDASVTRPHGGLGLGLSIVRHIVELHGGTVQAESEGAGRGAAFKVQLPVRAMKGSSIRRALPPLTSLAGVKVMIVDDDSDAREVVATALSQCGATVMAAATVNEAFDLLIDFRPDVIVSDIGMPNEDGYSLIRRIRAHRIRTLAKTPAIALTGFVHDDERRRALDEGYHRFVPKPVEVDELAAVIRSFVERPGAES